MQPRVGEQLTCQSITIPQHFWLLSFQRTICNSSHVKNSNQMLFLPIYILLSKIFDTLNMKTFSLPIRSHGKTQIGSVSDTELSDRSESCLERPSLSVSWCLETIIAPASFAIAASSEASEIGPPFTASMAACACC
jgi:hypothetical protein